MKTDLNKTMTGKPVYDTDRLQAFIEHLPISMAVLDRNMCYMAHSKKWVTDSLQKDECLKGRCHYDVVPGIPDHWKAEHQKCLAGEMMEKPEEPFRRQDGSIIWLRRRLIPLKSDPDQVNGIMIIAERVPQKKRIESILAEYPEKTPPGMEFAPATISFHLQKDGSISVPYISAGIRDVFGLEPKDLVNDAALLFARIHPEDARQVRDSIIESGRTMAPWDREFRVLHPDRGQLWIKGYSIPHPHPDEEGVTLYGYIRDITEKKKTRELLIQNEKMVSIGGLAAGLAHEINNPLSGILQNTQVILRRLSEDIPANVAAARESGTDMASIISYVEKRKIFELLEHVRISGLQATRTIQSMLNFARQKPFAAKAQDLSVIIEDTLTFLRQDHNFKSVHVIREFDPDLPKVPCDENRICQVILNIIRNSMDAVMEKQETLKGLTLCFRLINEKDGVRMEIEDNGPGMEEDVRKRIFEPFFTTKESGKGTGLGLSISYFLIADVHKGKIEVESTPGQGTTFAIRLPAA